MKCAVLGCGLGFSLSCILASHDHHVVGVDIVESAFRYPKLDKCMKLFIQQRHPLVHFTTDYRDVKDSELIFVFVNTPLENGRLSIRHVESAIESSLEHNNTVHFALLSTMPIGGCNKLFEKFPELKGRLNYVPPMVKQGMFLGTFTHPPSGWQMISDNANPEKILEVYKPILSPTVKYIFTDYRIVEVAKLVTNAFLTNKIVFANAVDDWCRKLGIPFGAFKVMEIVGADPRIGSQYITPGNPVGGPCLPRDVIELLSASEGTPFNKLLQTLQKLNEERGDR